MRRLLFVAFALVVIVHNSSGIPLPAVEEHDGLLGDEQKIDAPPTDKSKDAQKDSGAKDETKKDEPKANADGEKKDNGADTNGDKNVDSKHKDAFVRGYHAGHAAADKDAGRAPPSPPDAKQTSPSPPDAKETSPSTPAAGNGKTELGGVQQPEVKTAPQPAATQTKASDAPKAQVEADANAKADAKAEAAAHTAPAADKKTPTEAKASDVPKAQAAANKKSPTQAKASKTPKATAAVTTPTHEVKYKKWPADPKPTGHLAKKHAPAEKPKIKIIAAGDPAILATVEHDFPGTKVPNKGSFLSKVDKQSKQIVRSQNKSAKKKKSPART